eukprot:Skav205926  [mRNA]  locus=scaffold123:961942:968264:+ [translate_table: standard]
MHQNVDPSRKVQVVQTWTVDLTKLADIIGTKARAKYRDTRNCFRWLDEAKTGFVTRQECVQFMEVFGYNSSIGGPVTTAGQQVYTALLRPGQLEVDFPSFLRFFGPHIHPRYEDIAKQHEVLPPPIAASPRPERVGTQQGTLQRVR